MFKKGCAILKLLRRSSYSFSSCAAVWKRKELFYHRIDFSFHLEAHQTVTQFQRSMSSDGIKTVSSVKLVFIKAVNGRVKHVNQELVTNLRMLSAGFV